ncbi:hypothetical protein N9761_05790 [Flavobacteriaceae bacterium]|jgi:hypothetical protein|nr:hypothetical protein [Flavobacteriaceae bacterium]
MRTETKHLFNEEVSPNIKSLILKTRAGIILNENEKRKLNRFNESVSMKEIPKNPKGLVPPNHIPQPDEDELEDMIDLDELLREMGYGDDEDTEDITKLDRSSLKDLIKQEISNYFENEPQDEVDINEIIENLIAWDENKEIKTSNDILVGDELSLEEIMMELDEDDDELGENITYDISYISKSNGNKKYHTIRRDFKNNNHFSNWYKWMNNQGLKILGTHNVKE